MIWAGMFVHVVLHCLGGDVSAAYLHTETVILTFLCSAYSADLPKKGLGLLPRASSADRPNRAPTTFFGRSAE